MREQTNILNCKRGAYPFGHIGQAYGICLACERERLTRELASLAEAGTGYSQQTMDAMVKERDGLQSALLMERGKAEKVDEDNQRLRDALAEARELLRRVVDEDIELFDGCALLHDIEAFLAATRSPSAPPPAPESAPPR